LLEMGITWGILPFPKRKVRNMRDSSVIFHSKKPSTEMGGEARGGEEVGGGIGRQKETGIRASRDQTSFAKKDIKGQGGESYGQAEQVYRLTRWLSEREISQTNAGSDVTSGSQ